MSASQYPKPPFPTQKQAMPGATIKWIRGLIMGRLVTGDPASYGVK